MLTVWSCCALAWLVLPYRLVSRELTLFGVALLAVYIGAFVLGTLFVSGVRRPARAPGSMVPDASRAEGLLLLVSALASLFFILDARDKSLFDLALAYEVRTAAADALLKGEASTSSVWFQLAFVLYPAGYVYSAQHVLFARRISALRIALLSVLPIGLATLAQGGRVPLFYLMLVIWLSLRERRRLHPQNGPGTAVRRSGVRWWMLVLWAVVGAGLFAYFAAVFLVRAEAVGGAAGMFQVAEDTWGVAFEGGLSPLLFGLLGETVTYLLFVFVWYLVQGLVMSNTIFSEYDGPMQLGAYGIDLASAVARRIDPVGVAEGFDSLLSLGTYGFLPSAWGSFFVDFGMLGLLPALLWGAFTGYCHRRIVVDGSPRWSLVGPFVTLGIGFSLINTPLGFANGLVTHLWLLVAFLLLRRRAAPAS